MKTESDPQFNTKLLQVICQLHEWENQHLHLVQSQAGRYLYLSLVKQLIEEKRDQPSALLKGTPPVWRANPWCSQAICAPASSATVCMRLA